VKKIQIEAKLLFEQNIMKEEEAKFDDKKEDDGDIIKSQDTDCDDNQDEPKVVETDYEFEEKVRPNKRSSTLYSRESEDETTLDDFEIKHVIGIGSFGKVFLVEHNKTNNLHAMKRIDIEKVENTKLEEHILLNSEHPNIVGLDYVFKTEKRIYFIMNFIRGGELFKQIID